MPPRASRGKKGISEFYKNNCKYQFNQGWPSLQINT